MWPLKLIALRKMKPCSEGFSTHLWGFQGDRWKNIHFSGQPSLVTTQIDHLGKRSPVLRVSTHIYGVSKEIDGKTFIFQVNLGMWLIKLIISDKTNLVLMVTKHISGISKKIDGKTFIFQLNLVMWPLKSIILENRALFWGFQHTFMGFPRRWMEKH